MTQKRLLIITRHRLHENNGGANATKGFIHCLASIFDDCSLICPAFEGDATLYIPANVKLYPYHDQRSRITKGLDVWRGKICANEPYVKRHLKDHAYDIIVVDHSFAGALLVNAIKDTGAKMITIHHNVERDYQHDNRKEYSILFRWPYIHYAQKAEKECLQYSDINLTLTEKDALEFKSWYPDRDMHLYPWGTFDYRPMEDKTLSPKHKEPHFIITGSLYFMQSLNPIMEFIQHYWPLVKDVCHEARLTIAGRNPSQILYKTCKDDNSITIIPNPDDMAALVSQANYYICPINAGSGLKLRVMDGLKQGLPVLCHQISAAGYEPLEIAGCVYSYHNEESFGKKLHQLLTSEMDPNIVYQTFKKCFSLETGISRLNDILLQENIL